MKSFAGESQAKNRYEIFAKKAKKEGFVKIATIFEETASQEKEHAKRFFASLEGGALEITATFPAGITGSTAENLKASANGELEEHSDLYPEFAKIAKEEGFPEIATLWKMVSVAEKHHEKRFRDLLKELEAGEMFQKEKKVTWRCLNCGFIHESKEAPGKCPACAHPQSYFEENNTNW